MRKRIFLLALVCVAGVAFTACKRDFKCNCTDNAGYSTSVDFNNTDTDAAKAGCAAEEFLAQQEEANPSITCSID